MVSGAHDGRVQRTVHVAVQGHMARELLLESAGEPCMSLLNQYQQQHWFNVLISKRLI